MEVGLVDGPKSILVVGAHPDDPEFACAGSLIRWIEQGCRVRYLICTNGDKGSKDLKMTSERLAAIREAEQREAARRVGVEEVVFLGEPDGEFHGSLGNRERIARVVRQVRPGRLMVHDPWRRYQLHPDHRAVGFCTLDAVVAARDHLFLPRLLAEEGLAPHSVPEILLWGTDDPNVWVDTSTSIDRKLHAMRAHVSQVGRIADLDGRVRGAARRIGQAHGLEFAEEFHRVEQR